MKTVHDIIDALGGGKSVAEKLGVPVGTVGAWKHRLSVPPEHWLALTKIDPASGHDRVTLDDLALAHAKDATSERAA